jgi:hypothetical protein
MVSHVGLLQMTDRWQHSTDGYSFRFFALEQVDQIVRDGAKKGRAGSHAAIERILRVEPGLQRPELWKRIRQLKNLAPRPKYRHFLWSPEDERILRDGYRNGWHGKREAVRELLKRHPDWHPHAIWRQARKLGLVKREAKQGQDRTRQPWSDQDEGILLDLAGYKPARAIAKALHRSEAAVRSRLCILGKSSRVDLDGFSRHALAGDLHLSSRTIQRLIVQGLLEVRDPRITKESLDRLARSGSPPARECIPREATHIIPERVERNEIARASRSLALSSVEGVAPSRHSSRAKRVWTEVANSLGVPLAIVEDFIIRGALRMYDPTIPEKSLRNFCRRYGRVINSDALDDETRDWLQSVMDFDPRAGESVAERLETLRKHAEVVRRCRCGRAIRGNAFFRHSKRCRGMKSECEAGS